MELSNYTKARGESPRTRVYQKPTAFALWRKKVTKVLVEEKKGGEKTSGSKKKGVQKGGGMKRTGRKEKDQKEGRGHKSNPTGRFTVDSMRRGGRGGGGFQNPFFYWGEIEGQINSWGGGMGRPMKAGGKWWGEQGPNWGGNWEKRGGGDYGPEKGKGG